MEVEMKTPLSAISLLTREQHEELDQRRWEDQRLAELEAAAKKHFNTFQWLDFHLDHLQFRNQVRTRRLNSKQ